MRKVILDLAVTLDGFIEGVNGEIDWCMLEDDMKFDAFLESVDTIFYGRTSYDLWGNFQPDAAATNAEKAMWSSVHSKQKVVFSSRPAAGDRATFIAWDMVTRVNEIKNQPGKAIWLYGGAKLITSFMHHGLIDVYRLSVHPVVLGKGKPLFEKLQDRLNLTLISAQTFKSGVVQLIYEPQHPQKNPAA